MIDNRDIVMSTKRCGSPAKKQPSLLELAPGRSRCYLRISTFQGDQNSNWWFIRGILQNINLMHLVIYNIYINYPLMHAILLYSSSWWKFHFTPTGWSTCWTRKERPPETCKKNTTAMRCYGKATFLPCNMHQRLEMSRMGTAEGLDRLDSLIHQAVFTGYLYVSIYVNHPRQSISCVINQHCGRYTHIVSIL